MNRNREAHLLISAAFIFLLCVQFVTVCAGFTLYVTVCAGSRVVNNQRVILFGDDSKSGLRYARNEGSNPSLSAKKLNPLYYIQGIFCGDALKS